MILTNLFSQETDFIFSPNYLDTSLHYMNCWVPGGGDTKLSSDQTEVFLLSYSSLGERESLL